VRKEECQLWPDVTVGDDRSCNIRELRHRDDAHRLIKTGPGAAIF
jgi:hypothetical protein